MAYKYQSIWDEVKKTHRAEVTVSKLNAPTVIQGVKKVKSRESVTNKLAGLPPWPVMAIKKEEISSQFLKVIFELNHDFRI